MSNSDNRDMRELNPRRTYRKFVGALVYGLFLFSVLVGIIGLGALIYEVLSNGISWLNWQFITD